MRRAGTATVPVACCGVSPQHPSASGEPFYHNSIRKSLLCNEAASWFQTPFRGKCQIKGYGVDCVHFAAACYEATGFLEDFHPPEYSLAEGSHLAASKVEAFIAALGCFDTIWKTDFGPRTLDLGPLLTGDLLALRMGRVSHHVGLMLGGEEFAHVYIHSRVHTATLRDATWRRRLTGIYRPVIPAPDLTPNPNLNLNPA